MATKGGREKIKLESSAGTGHFYTTSKNKKTMPEKMAIMKFDPKARKHVEYKEITTYLIPRLGRFNWQGERDRSANKASLYRQILDSAGGRAHRVCSAGLMAGMSSPARPWFRLTLSDKELIEYAPVKLWLKDSAEALRDIFTRTNTYRALHSMYDELVAFGTGVDIMEDDTEAVAPPAAVAAMNG